MSRLHRLAAISLLGAASAAQAQAQDHQHMHGMDSAPAASEAGPTAAAPPPAADHAADRFYDPAEMASARRMLAYENGGMPASLFRIDRLERRIVKGGDGYHWEGEGFVGGDIDRLAIKSEGEGGWKGRLERAEVQALYSHAIGPWFNLQAGLRHDVRPSPQRSYAVVAVEGLAPYWFEVEGSAFLSDKGDLHLRFEASYDQRITQRWILQPQVELNLAAQDVRAIGVGAGLSSAEAGLRLRYEIVRAFAPYIGLTWERKFGDTARFARAAGDRRQATGLAIGVRTWF